MKNESANHLDVTERKRLQHELKKRVKKISSLEMMEAMMDGVCVIDVDAKIIEVNSAFEKLTGYTKDELLGEAPLKLHPERERETILAGIRECMERGFVTDFETVFLRRDKEEIPILLNATLAKDAEGKPKWVIATFRDITKRKRTEQELQGSHNLLCTVAEATPDIIFVKDLQGRYMMLNSACARCFGTSREEVIGKDDTALLSPETARYLMEFDRSIMTSGEAETFEEAVTSFGKTRTYLTTKAPYRDHQGNIIGLIGIARDITERKRLEHELKERVKELDCLYGIARIAEKPGITLDELYQEVADFLPESWQYPQIACARIIIDNKRFETENCRETEWKQSSDIKVRAARAGVVEVCYLEERPEIDEGPFLEEERLLIDAVAEQLGIITEHKRAEEALRETEARLRSLVESTSDWVWEVDVNGVYTYVSPKVKDLLGYELEEVIGKTPFDLMPPEEAKRIAEEFQAIVESHRPFARLENTNRHKDGRLVVLETSGVPFFDADGRLCGYRGIDRDITKRKRLEHELKERVKELNCLYAIARIAEKPDITLDELYQEVADLLPGGWQYPEITCARIIIDNKSFKTENYRGTEWTQSSDIKVREARAGVVQVCYLEERPEIDEGPFLEQERLLIDAVAERLGRIIERKQAEETRVAHAAALARAEELQQSRQRIVKVQEVQRRDIAQQLHGSVQNRLIVLLHRLTELERAASPGELAAELRDLRQNLGELLDSHIRPISHRLYPSILHQGLVPALQSLGDQFEATVAIEMALDEELMRQERAERGLIPERVRLTAYRIVEEALNNMVKYAKASRAAIGLELSPEGWLRLTVRDDGQGFDVGSASGGLGILMMQDYAGVVGGECVIRSAPGEGTEVTATLPLARPGAKHPERASPLE